ncbi:MAG: SusD/RagB family nutrient-binding outer membrane lipoprotein [Cyclobacteriaceae bacterium]|nr:SusD/RagB family nutrient-binding outer membrane lipoprotein [Cyclobacteriaceae bacterium]
MKRNKLYKYILAFGLLTTFACSDLLDVNTDPNNASDSTPQLTLPPAQVSLATILESNYNIHGSILANYWTQGPTASQYSGIEQYNITTNTYGGAWAALYSGTLTDLQFVKRSAQESGVDNYAAIAQLLQVYTFQILVDLYDKVPYSEALKGKSGELTPNFDDGEDVYDDLIVKIDEALSWINLSTSAVRPGQEDLIYRGDMRKWIKFANTLKLKIYIRQAIARPDVAQAGIEELYLEGAEFIAPGEDARVGFSDATGSNNPLFQELDLTTPQNLVASLTSTDALQNDSDARLGKLYDRSPNTGQYDGLVQGVGTADGGVYNDYARPDSTIILNKSAAVYLMTGYESLFLQAEAVQRSWGTGSAKTLYDNAVLASFAFWGVNGSSMIGTGGAYEFDNTLERIYYQKWIAFNGKQGFEGWTEWRRTGVPVLVKSVQGIPLTNVFPLRLIWPINETSSNPNVPALESVDAPVWWDTTF